MRAASLAIATAALTALAAAGAPAGGGSSATPTGTRIVAGPPAKTFARHARFSFGSSAPGASFECRLDRSDFRPCPPRYRTPRLDRGRHSLEVRAAAPGEAADPTPARRRWKVLRRRVDLGESVRGTTVRATRVGDPVSRRSVVVVGSIHGDEAEGHEVIGLVRDRYRDLKEVDLWTLETVNPDGVAAGTRGNARGVDLNRNFSHRWEGGVPRSSEYWPGPRPFSEPESRLVRRLLRRVEPRVTIWYHQPWGQVLLPCSGKAEEEQRYARVADWPTKRCRGERLPGTATSWQEHRVGGTAFVVELRGGDLGDATARRHARAVAAVAKRR